ncbi:hypothetical protein B0H15DRAFT_802978 [Mycena belliarum]|uniref:Uncharacterized protein n=1 Tax=Mycena belliarum TaxID=1033014 RepID=A0AAD6XP39_9AGAR|nr:hypothetical protein B0H15DRAFT_802978 [Mycena belliae]
MTSAPQDPYASQPIPVKAFEPVRLTCHTWLVAISADNTVDMALQDQNPEILAARRAMPAVSVPAHPINISLCARIAVKAVNTPQIMLRAVLEVRGDSLPPVRGILHAPEAHLRAATILRLGVNKRCAGPLIPQQQRCASRVTTTAVMRRRVRTTLKLWDPSFAFALRRRRTSISVVSDALHVFSDASVRALFAGLMRPTRLGRHSID